MANHVCNQNPPLVEDVLFKNADNTGLAVPPCVRLPYSKLSLEDGRDHPPKLHATVDIRTTEQTEMVFQSPSCFKPNLERSATVTGVENGDKEGEANVSGAVGGGGPLRRCRSVSHWLKEAVGPKDGQPTYKESAHF